MSKRLFSFLKALPLALYFLIMVSLVGYLLLSYFKLNDGLDVPVYNARRSTTVLQMSYHLQMLSANIRSTKLDPSSAYSSRGVRTTIKSYLKQLDTALATLAKAQKKPLAFQEKQLASLREQAKFFPELADSLFFRRHWWHIVLCILFATLFAAITRTPNDPSIPFQVNV